MRVADAEPIDASGLEGQHCYRLHRASGRPACHESDRSMQPSVMWRIELHQTISLRTAQLPSKSRSYFQVAHTMRASLLASATVALL